MAKEPKAPRKRASKKTVEEKPAKKSAAILAPIFQAAPVVATKLEKSATKEKPAKSKVKEKQSDLVEKHDDDSDSRRGSRRRRRGGVRGGHGLRHPER